MNYLRIPPRTFAVALTHLRGNGEPAHKAHYKALRLMLAATGLARHMRAWYAFLDRPENAVFLAANRDLPLKPVRAYLSRRWGAATRVRALKDTYALAGEKGGVLRHALLVGGESVLATLDFGDAGKVEAVLSRPHVYREGEFLLFLRFAGRPLAAKTTFSFHRPPAGPLALHIGCIQGGTDGEEVRKMEKAMHGLRPKFALFFALQEFGRALGASEVFGIGDGIQIKSGKWRPRQRDNLRFGYDAFWEESGGQRQRDGWFRLPARLERRAPEDMKPNKRSMYKKRYAMMDDLAAQLHAALAGGVPI